MAPSFLRGLALAGMAALLVGGAACAETPESETPDATQDDSIEAVRARENIGDAETPDAQTPQPTQDDSIAPVRTRGNTGDAEAQVTLGLMYATGEGVTQDAVEAADLFEGEATRAPPPTPPPGEHDRL